MKGDISMKITLIATLFLFSSAFALTGLKVGDKAPDVSVKTVSGKSFNFSKQDKNTVIVFYRGSWCPYCIRQLQSLEKEVVPNLGDTQLIAVSVDKLKVAKKMKSKNKFSFLVGTDSKANSLKAFKIVNKLDDELVEKYKSAYKIDVEGDSGENHHMVAHPAVFVIKDGKITYADIHDNYKERTKNEEIIRAIK